MSLLAAVEHAASVLDAVDGIRATAEGGAIRPPCVWVAPRQTDVVYLDGGTEVGLDLYLIAPAAAKTVDTLATLDRLLEAVAANVPADGPAVMTAVALADSATTCPALRVPVTITL